MVTTRPGISVQADVWERFRNEIEQGERSKILENLMRDYLEIDNSDLEELKNRLDEKETELKELKSEKDKIEKDIAEVENSISSIRSSISELKRSNQEKREDWDRFLEAANDRGLKDIDWNDKQVAYWEDELDMDWSDIVEKAKKEVKA